MGKMDRAMVRAVFFDVDFTLIYPGPTFSGSGYEQFCARHGLTIDAHRFEEAVANAARVLDDRTELLYDPRVFIDYTKAIITALGGVGPGIDACAREIYDEWAACHHFELYPDVEPTFVALHDRGIKIGLISNTHRCLASFQAHFELDPYVSGAVSSSDHGFMKPHPSIFEAGLRLLDVRASEAVMVGDSPLQDIQGAAAAGLHAVLLDRARPAGQGSPRVASAGDSAGPGGSGGQTMPWAITRLPELVDLIDRGAFHAPRLPVAGDLTHPTSGPAFRAGHA